MSPKKKGAPFFGVGDFTGEVGAILKNGSLGGYHSRSFFKGRENPLFVSLTTLKGGGIYNNLGSNSTLETPFFWKEILKCSPKLVWEAFVVAIYHGGCYNF